MRALVEAGIATQLGALARRRAAEARRDRSNADRREVCGPRRRRSHRHAPRAVPDDGDRRGDAGRHRRPADRPRDPRRPHPRCPHAAPARSLRGPAFRRLPSRPSADALVPRRAGRAARDRLRQPLPDGEGGRRLHGRGRGDRRAARLAGRGRDRERAPVRVGDALVDAARVPQRGRRRARQRARARPAAADRRQPAAVAHRCRERHHRASARRRICASRRPQARTRTASSACRSRRARRRCACWSAAGPSGSTR